MATWPVWMPVRPQMDGFSGQAPDPLLQSSMEAGEPKTRRRYTATYVPLQVSWVVDLSVLNAFLDWIRDELADGALRDTPCRAKFPKEGLPSYAPHGAKWKISATVWLLP